MENFRNEILKPQHVRSTFECFLNLLTATKECEILLTASLRVKPSVVLRSSTNKCIAFFHF